jgi:hypothetical protein
VFVFSLPAVETASQGRVSIRFAQRTTVHVALLAGALEEAARIWRPYGIVVTADSSTADAESVAELLVGLDVDHETGGSLGEIRFADDGIPASSAILYFRPLLRLVDTSPLGSAARQLPLAVHDRLLSRALGRALAHEVGHFVLRSPHHSSRGLMRSRHSASMLTEPSANAFRLTDIDVARLNVVMAAREAGRLTRTY